uniref:Uncharacterized protein n=1 Tax=Trichogramma kaykai TaxID=54128 RepID=A0ABD2WXJ0_9HYME
MYNTPVVHKYKTDASISGYLARSSFHDHFHDLTHRGYITSRCLDLRKTMPICTRNMYRKSSADRCGSCERPSKRAPAMSECEYARYYKDLCGA